MEQSQNTQGSFYHFQMKRVSQMPSRQRQGFFSLLRKLLFLASLLSIPLAMALPDAGAATSAAPSTSQKIKVVLALDGFSLNALKTAQSQGLFQEFKNVGAHIAPFPSMTDLSWSQIFHTSHIFGDAGRIKSVEAVYFDESTNSIQGDPRDYYRRLSFPKYYMGAFDHFFNPFVEALMYFPTQEVPKLEVKSVVDRLLGSPVKSVMTGYVGAVDSLAHTQKDRLYPVLKQIDSEIKRLIAGFKEKNIRVEVILISDHGNVGNFKEGSPESELLKIDLQESIEDAGFDFVQQLKNDKDVAVPLMALGTWAPVYTKNRKQIPSLISSLRKEKWFDLATYIHSSNAKVLTVVVASATGAATLQLNRINQTYIYRPQYGNPLNIGKNFQNKWLNAAEAQSAMQGTNYPDGLRRLLYAALQKDFDYPDMILTAKDGYCFDNPLSEFTKMYRTHGSLSTNSSLGVVASTETKVPAQVNSHYVLSTFNIDPKNLFGKTAYNHQASGENALYSMNGTVQTAAGQFSDEIIFRYLGRFTTESRPFFVISEIKEMIESLKVNTDGTVNPVSLSPLAMKLDGVNPTNALSPDDIGALTDAVLQAKSLGDLQNDSRILAIREKIPALASSKQATLSLQQDKKGEPSLLERLTSLVLPAKRSVMKAYQLPYLLERALVVQEQKQIPDTRDARFARYWNSQSYALVDSAKALNQKKDDVSVAARLFKEVWKENALEDKAYPLPLNKVYNEKLSETTIVYVPGIYNSIFDKEIFSIGLNAISDELGLRVLTAPVFSTCAAEVNGAYLMKFLTADSLRRMKQGHAAPKYVILGYSKGAVDALHALTQMPEWASKNIRALVSIGSPLQGSSIINKSDVPFEVVRALSNEKVPEVCETEKTASKSATPQALSKFWRKNKKSLIGLTRYFSLTFVSQPENSHIFMRATKLIGQFEEDNDGVVTVSSSKFPKELGAVDLGIIEGDHLAGILASRFDQKGFMKAIINTLAELKVDSDVRNLAWNAKQITGQESIWKKKEIDQVFVKNRQVYLRRIMPNVFGPVDTRAISNSYQLNRQVFPKSNDPADTYEVKTELPANGLNYDPYNSLDVAKLADILEKAKVTPLDPKSTPNGIDMTFNHQHIVEFRMDHQMNYESRSPEGCDDNQEYGLAPTENGMLMRSKSNSIRLTTMAYRFRAADFPKMDLGLQVNDGVEGADPVKNGSGKDDSAFQLWFTIRVKNSTGDRSLLNKATDQVILFGYYWGDPLPGTHRKAGDIFENYYSNKNVVVATLPYAKQLLLNNPGDLGKDQTYNRNLLSDLQKAFPEFNAKEMEIIGLTLQHDSNDAENDSEAIFKHLKFTP